MDSIISGLIWSIAGSVAAGILILRWAMAKDDPVEISLKIALVIGALFFIAPIRDLFDSLGILDFRTYILTVVSLTGLALVVTRSEKWRIRRGNELLASSHLDDALYYFDKAACQDGLQRVGDIALEDIDRFHDTAFRAYKRAQSKAGLLRVGGECVKKGTSLAESEIAAGLLSTAVSAYSEVPDTTALIQVGDICIERAKLQTAWKGKRKFLWIAREAYEKASNATKLVQLADLCIEEAKSQTKWEIKEEFVSVAKTASERAYYEQGVKLCKNLYQEITKARITEEQKQYSWLKPGEKRYTPSTGSPTIIIYNSDKSMQIEVTLDFYNVSTIKAKDHAMFQVEPGLHVLEISPVVEISSEVRSEGLRGKISLDRDYTYIWSVGVKTEWEYRYRYY